MRYLTVPALAMSFMLASCAAPTLVKTAAIDPTEKTISVPPGSAMAPIKQALAQAGWSIRSSGATTATGPFWTSVKAGKLPARYTMAASMRYYDLRVYDMARLYHYDISVLDTKTEEEVLSMSGTSDPATIGRTLVQALNSP